MHIHVCMYVCMYIYIYIYTYIHTSDGEVAALARAAELARRHKINTIAIYVYSYNT